jgi:hypothetical protein
MAMAVITQVASADHDVVDPTMILGAGFQGLRQLSTAKV